MKALWARRGHGARAIAAAAVMIVWMACQGVHAVPADGAYEGDVRPDQAEPAWTGGRPKSDAGSLIQWTTAKDGVLVQREDAPKDIMMHMAPAPITNTSFTVETRFRVTQCSREGRYKSPLSFYVCVGNTLANDYSAGYGYPSAKGPGEVGYFAGKVGFADGTDVNEAILDDRFISGEWVTVRTVMKDNRKERRAILFVDGEKFIEEATPIEGGRSEFFGVGSRDDNDGWELDYIRWKNEALDIATPLDRPMTKEEKAEAEEAGYRRKIDALLEGM